MRKNFFATDIKNQAVRLVIEHRMSVKAVSEQLGVQVGPITVWVRRYREERLRVVAFQRLQGRQRNDMAESNAAAILAADILMDRPPRT
jgi:transposase-like protein